MTGQDEAELRARALSFGSVAAEYAALRPGYPADAVAFLVGDGGRRVLDVGAGTGLLTEVVLGAGHDVTAVDPSPEMLAELVARLPAVTAAVGSAEALPVDDASVDAVVAGQAAHWFDPAPAAREIRRVLRPGGVLGLIWNTPTSGRRGSARSASSSARRRVGTRPTRASSTGSPRSSRPRWTCSSPGSSSR
jgi:SAM-dependent methyltransferase